MGQKAAEGFQNREWQDSIFFIVKGPLSCNMNSGLDGNKDECRNTKLGGYFRVQAERGGLLFQIIGTKLEK